MAPRVSKLFSLVIILTFLLLPLGPLQSYAKFKNPEGEKPSSFGFLKHLQGCHKGDKVKGLHDLKVYLKEFGYLDDHHSDNQTHEDDDDFDESLETAIKTYQHNYHLNATGNLDGPTVSKMIVPRCGMPDISNGTNWMQAGDKKNGHDHHGSNSFHIVAHFAFPIGNPRWTPSVRILTYGFPAGFPAAVIPPVTRAFNSWASVTRFTFEMTIFEMANLKISFNRGDHGDGFPFDGPGGILAHAFYPTDGRCHFDADESWSIGAIPGAYDLETLALHEIGHLLGLEHSSVADAIMFPTFSPGTTKGLHLDDILGIRTLYYF